MNFKHAEAQGGPLDGRVFSHECADPSCDEILCEGPEGDQHRYKIVDEGTRLLYAGIVE